MQSRNRAYATVYEIDLLNPVSTSHTNTSTGTGTSERAHTSVSGSSSSNKSAQIQNNQLPLNQREKLTEEDIPSSASISSTGGASGSEYSGSSNASGFVISACCPTLSFPSQPLLSFIIACYSSLSGSGIRYLCIALCVLWPTRRGRARDVTEVRGVFGGRGEVDGWTVGMEWMVG